MARKVFFSFHYDNDVWRANVVRNSWVTKPNSEKAGFMDKAEFEELKRKGSAAVEKWIDEQLSGTSVTVVLIGSETIQRPFVRYELQQSFKKGNGIIGIYIDQIKDENQKTSARGNIQGLELGKDQSGNPVYFSSCKTYNWFADDGYNKLGGWVETAATAAGR